MFITNKHLIGSIFLFAIILVNQATIGQCAKFEPPNGSALFLIGRDLRSIGGQGNNLIGGYYYNLGYLDQVGGLSPGGFSHYTGLEQRDGLTSVAQYCHGHYAVEKLTSTNQFQTAAISIGLSCTANNIDNIINGNGRDAHIKELANWCKSQGNRPIFLRIAYQFDERYAKPYNGDSAVLGADYIAAWRKIVRIFRYGSGDSLTPNPLWEPVNNVAFVWQAAWGDFDNPIYNEFNPYDYYPGDDYVDWFGCSVWSLDRLPLWMLREAKNRNKPVMICESSDKGLTFSQNNAQIVWNNWFTPVIDLIKGNTIYAAFKNTIKAWTLDNVNWEGSSDNCWQSWGDQRIQNSVILKEFWLKEMENPFWIHSSDSLYAVLSNCRATPPLRALAGDDIVINSPNGNINIIGQATGGVPNYQYFWTVISGPSDNILNTQTGQEVSLRGLREGVYVLSLLVSDQNSQQAYDELKLTVTQINKTPYLESPSTIPGIIENEFFDRDGNGIAYYDNTIGNAGLINFRANEDVDIIQIPSGYAITNTENGEWLDYTVNVTETDFYQIAVTVSCGGSYNGFIKVVSNGMNLIETTPITSTHDWNNYFTLTFNNISLSQENNKHIRIYAQGINLDNITFVRTGETAESRDTINIAGRGYKVEFNSILDEELNWLNNYDNNLDNTIDTISFVGPFTFQNTTSGVELFSEQYNEWDYVSFRLPKLLKVESAYKVALKVKTTQPVYLDLFPITVSTAMNYDSLTLHPIEVIDSAYIEKMFQAHSYVTGFKLHINNAYLSGPHNGWWVQPSSMFKGILKLENIEFLQKDCNGTWRGLSIVDSCGQCVEINPILDPTLCGSNVINTESDLINFYPNPVNNILYIKTQNETDNLVKLIDMQGRLVYKNQLQGNNLSVDVHHLKKGIYLLELVSNKSVKRKQIVIY